MVRFRGKRNALRYGGFDELVINKLDALSMDQGWEEKLKICSLSFSDETTTVSREARNPPNALPALKRLTDGRGTLG